MPAGYVPLTKGPVRAEYRLVPDRDVNGVGLIYFANYPVFLDICERQILAGTELPFTDDLLDRRTPIRRRIAYLSNASGRDTLDIEIEAWIENPFALAHPQPEAASIRLLASYRMYRRSDRRLMMAATAQKTITGCTAGALPFFDKLRS